MRYQVTLPPMILEKIVQGGCHLTVANLGSGRFEAALESFKLLHLGGGNSPYDAISALENKLNIEHPQYDKD